MPARKFLPGVLLGLIPTAIVYAVAVAYALDLQTSVYVFFSVTALAGMIWVIGKVM